MTRTAAPTDLLAATPFLMHAQHRTGALMSMLQAHWFIRLRWAFVGVSMAVLALERFVTPEAIRPGALALPVVLLAIVNLIWMGLADFLLREFRRPDADERRTIRHAMLFANAQVCVDLFLLTLILRYTGGVENPMAVFYLFHMGIGAMLLKEWHAILQGIWAMLLYTILAVGEWTGRIAPHWDFLPQFASPGLYVRGEFVAAMLAVMGCGIFATLYFTLHITGRLDERERQLRDAFEALKRSEAAIFDLQQRRSRFLQTAAHQLKGPLASIETFTGLLLDGIVPENAVRSTYQKIAQRCREGAQQVGELLTLARVQRADPRRHRQSIADVGRVAIEVCERYAPLAESRGIALHCHVPKEGGFYAFVDAADLTDCISNLVDNAIKFTNGPGEVTVTVAHGDEDDAVASPEVAAPAAAGGGAPGRPDWGPECVMVSVVDTGIGIEPEALAAANDPTGKGSVFDAFRRGNNALAAGIPGTGLGLAIVREVVEQAEGRIIVRSRRGEGSRFTVAFPSRFVPPMEPSIRDTRASVVVLDETDHVVAAYQRPPSAAASRPAAGETARMSGLLPEGEGDQID